MKIGVKFCGGCNPCIDRRNVIERVQGMLPPGNYTFKYFDFNDCELFIAVNGCSLACAEFANSKNVIIVAGFEIDSKKYSEEELPFEVLKRLEAVVTSSKQ